MPLTHDDLAAKHWNEYKLDAFWSGYNPAPAECNMRAGEQLAERHDRILAIARFELGSSDLVDMIDEMLTDSVDASTIGHDGAAAYFEARASLAALVRRAAA